MPCRTVLIRLTPGVATISFTVDVHHCSPAITCELGHVLLRVCGLKRLACLQSATSVLRFLDEYDTKVSAGPFKYKRAAEFLMNVPIGGLKSIVKDLIAAKTQALDKAKSAETAIAQVGSHNNQHSCPSPKGSNWSRYQYSIC